MRFYSTSRRSISTTRYTLALSLAATVAFALTPAHALAQDAPARAPGAAARPTLTKAPKLVQFVEAAYPESERAAGRSAAVVLQIAISEAGDVSDVTVQESQGAAFDQAAITAARQFKFDPAEVDGKKRPRFGSSTNTNSYFE